MMNLHPLGSRHIASLLATQLETRFFPNSQHFSDHVDRLDSSGVSVLIKKRIARNLNCVSQANRSVRVMFCRDPAGKEVVPITHTAATIELVVRQAFSQSS